MQDCKLISVDLAKNVFQVCILNDEGSVILNKRFKRQKFIELIASYKPTKIAMESCYSANYFGRLFESYGHTVKLIPAQHVKAFVRGNKNDANDALAIAEASQRPNLRYVKIKTIEQQDIQSIHRIRDHKVSQRTALTNQVRGLLTEYGMVAPTGDKSFKSLIHNALESNQITPMFKEEVASLYEEWLDLQERIKRIENKLKAYAEQQGDCKRLMSIPGIGIINATALYSSIGDASQFATARDLAVWMGLTPKQHASGTKSSMGSITKRGNRYLRKQLIHGARAYAYRAKGKNGLFDQWIHQLTARVGKHKAYVAIAHKLARVIWAVLTKKESWQVQPI